MADPTFTQETTPGGKPRVRMFWYFNGDKIRKTFSDQKSADQWVRKHRKGAGVVERSLLEADGTEQADIITALDLARENGFTLTEAARAYIEARPAVVARITIEDTESDFYQHCRRENVRTITVEKYEGALRMLKAKVNKPANEITKSDIEDFLDNPDWSFSTRNWYIRHCRPYFNWLLDAGRISTSPFGGVKQKPTDDVAPCIFTVKQTKALLKTAAESDRGTLPYLTIGLFSGIRPAGLERLTWNDIDLGQKVIHVPGATNKTRDRYVCDIQPNLLKWLQPIEGNDIIPINFRKRYEAIRLRAGIKWGQDIMRHTFASHHLSAFQDAGKTAFQLGHKGDPTMLFNHYRNIVTPAEGKRFFKIVP